MRKTKRLIALLCANAVIWGNAPYAALADVVELDADAVVTGKDASDSALDDYEAYFSFDGTIGDATPVKKGYWASIGDYTEKEFVYVNGKHGKAIAINYEDEEVERDDVGFDTNIEIDSQDSFTISFWAKAYEAPFAAPIVFVGRKEQNPENWIGFWSGFNNGTWSYAEICSAGWIEAGASLSSTAEFGYTHITFSVDAETHVGTLYYDGVQVAQTEEELPTLYDNSRIYIGADAWDCPAHMEIDDLMIYRKVLSDEQVAELYEAGGIPTEEQYKYPNTKKLCNIETELMTNKLVYNSSEDIEVSVKVTNDSDYTVNDVCVDALFPNIFKNYIGDTTELTLSELQAHSSQEMNFTLGMRSDVGDSPAGDINGDGKIGSKDAVVLKKYLAGFENISLDVAVADVNGDSAINSKDAVRLLRWLAGYEVELCGVINTTTYDAAKIESGDYEYTVDRTISVDGESYVISVNTSFTVPEQPMAEDDDVLRYQLWEDGPIAEYMLEAWEEDHPDDPVEIEEVPVGNNNEILLNKWGTSEMPDLFWVLGTPDFAIEEGMLADVTDIWAADADTQNIVGGINEFGLGTLGTGRRYLMPVQFFPTEAWVNMRYFELFNTNMPDIDWTFEDMMDYVESLTPGDESRWALSEAVSVITWYPIASGEDCIGEFGWNGSEFDFNSWADGLMIEKELRDSGFISPATVPGTTDQYPQDLGMVAMRMDNWWCWERFWDKEEMYCRQVYWVPYMLPHTKENKDSDVQLATINFGGISAMTSDKELAYEALKFFTWDADGWQYKMEHYDEIVASSITEEGFMVSCAGVIAAPLNNCPITLDETTWNMYEAMHPTTLAGGDIEGEEQYDIDRAPYFDAFFDKVKELQWTCYGSGQIAGYNDIWNKVLIDDYFGERFGEYADIESAVLEGGYNPYDYVEEFNASANAYHREALRKLWESIRENVK